MSSGRVRFDHVVGLWDDGVRRLHAADPADRVAMERVVDALVDGLRHRLGGNFTAQELTDLYIEQGIDWCFDVAIRVAPNTPAAWDLATVGHAAYARYLRRAIDYGGGRRLHVEED